jgi:hypothetical protein
VLTITVSETHVSRFAHRYLYSNRLTSSIPPTIGQLTALKHLYVFVLTIAVSELTPLELTPLASHTHRYLYINQLRSSIPLTIGTLTALQYLYVFVLTIQCRSSRYWLRTQDSFRQPVDKLDSVDDWTIDGTHLLVRVRVDYSVRNSRIWLRTQVSCRQPVDKFDSVDDWTIDGTHLLVRVRVDYSVGAYASCFFARRDVSNNQFTSSIPSTIGQLTALTFLYVFVLTIQCRNSRFWLRTQGPCWQPVDKFDSVDDWTSVKSHYLV